MSFKMGTTAAELADYWLTKTDAQLVQAVMESGQTNIDFQALASSQIKPFFIHVAGGIGSGKSHVMQSLDHFIRQNETDLGLFYNLKFDTVMENTPAYQADVKSQGIEIASRKWELPARVVSYRILADLMKHGVSVLFEHSGVVTDHQKFMLEAKHGGYETRYVFIETSLKKALARIATREENPTMRRVERKTVEERFALLQDLKKAYQAMFENIVIDNNEDVALSAEDIWAQLKIKSV